MRSKGFESLSIEPSGEVKVVPLEAEGEEAAAETAEKAVEESSPEKKATKVDRRQKLPPKPKVEPGPGDVELTKEHIEAAREELWVEGKDGNQNPTEEEILSRARMGVFSTMPDREVAERAIDAILASEEDTKAIVEKTNKAFRDSAIATEENARKWEEVDRVEEIEQERKREEIERVRALNGQAGQDDRDLADRARKAHIERIEQSRKREEVARVEAIEQERKREEAERVRILNSEKAKVARERSLKETIFKKEKTPAQEAKAPRPEIVEAVAPVAKTEEPKKHRSLREIIFGKK